MCGPALSKIINEGKYFHCPLKPGGMVRRRHWKLIGDSFTQYFHLPSNHLFTFYLQTIFSLFTFKPSFHFLPSNLSIYFLSLIFTWGVIHDWFTDCFNEILNKTDRVLQQTSYAGFYNEKLSNRLIYMNFLSSAIHSLTENT